MTNKARITKRQWIYPRRVLTNEDLCEKYPWVVPGSLRGKGSIRTIAIRCQKRGCDKTRRTRTSSAYQVHFCKKHQRERDLMLLAARRKRWKDRERAKRKGAL